LILIVIASVSVGWRLVQLLDVYSEYPYSRFDSALPGVGIGGFSSDSESGSSP
jgi:hypothetical protein